MNNPNQDEQIIYNLATNFEYGFKMLFLAYYKPLKRVAQKTIGEEFAEDIVQDTFMTIWNTRNKFDNIQIIKAYLYNTVHNKCLNVIRKENLFEKYQAEHQEEVFEEHILDEEIYIQLYEALDSLPEHYKIAMLRSLNGESITNIAKAMDKTEDTIKAYKRRSKQLLKKKLCKQAYLLVFFC